MAAHQSLLGYLEDSASSGAHFTFIDEAGVDAEVSAGRLWRKAALRAGGLEERLQGAAVGAILTSDAESCATVVGAFLAGVDLVSLPIPHRREPLDSYADRLRRICSAADVGLVLVAGAYASFLTDLVPGITAMEEVLGSRAHPGSGVSSRFTQFSSGTTVEPRGIVHSQETLLANALGIIEALEMAPNETVCSWLPLSHDMGLVGVFLTACVAGGRRWSDGGHAVIMQPERFLRRPRAWMEACAHHGATITAAPCFAYEMAARAFGPAHLDLSALRACLIGAEPVRRGTLDAFAIAAGAHGLPPTALCPAYGLAEAAAAVTMTRPSQPWRVLASPSGSVFDSLGETVSCGSPLPDVSVRVVEPDAAGIGQVVIESPSAFIGELAARGYEEREGPIVTNDLGRMADGELGLHGRVDDVLVIGGRNLIATELEGQLRERCGDTMAGVFAVVPADGGYWIITESGSRGACPTPAEVRSIRAAALGCWGIGPSAVVTVGPGSIPRTTSGKIRRHELARLVAAGAL